MVLTFLNKSVTKGDWKRAELDQKAIHHLDVLPLVNFPHTVFHFSERNGCISYFCCLHRRSQDGFHTKTKLSALQN